MKILLTGASGFIGRALLSSLDSRGHEITVLSRRNDPSLPPAVTAIIAETKDWATAVEGKSFDLCLHLAWIATPGIYLDSPENERLAAASIALADTLFQSGLPHLLALGTCIEYAPGPTAPCSEISTKIAPQSIYGLAKERARSGIAAAAGTTGGGYTWARIFYPYGAGEHANRIPSIFLRTLFAGRPLELKTADSIKDFIEIRDVVSALVHLSERGIPEQEINIGTGAGTRIGDLAEIAARITENNSPRITVAAATAPDPYSFHVADTRKLASSGWKPTISLPDGLERLFKNLSLRTQ
jgi:nucleoside-diphosphate-sugar epimerase